MVNKIAKINPTQKKAMANGGDSPDTIFSNSVICIPKNISMGTFTNNAKKVAWKNCVCDTQLERTTFP